MGLHHAKLSHRTLPCLTPECLSIKPDLNHFLTLSLTAGLIRLQSDKLDVEGKEKERRMCMTKHQNIHSFYPPSFVPLL